jgi:predicted transcriptional regulator
MRTRKYVNDITPRDLDILNILWDTGKPMIASEIASSDETLTMNTVQAVLRKLLKKKLIKIDDIVYSGTVLCRRYRPTISSDEFTISQLTSEYRQMNKNVSTAALLASFLETEPDTQKAKKEIEELQQMLEEYKQRLD